MNGAGVIMRFTDDEQRYLELLAGGKTFEQMARTLGWTYREVVAYGERFFGCDFEERSKKDPLFSMLMEECTRYRFLLMRACKVLGAEELVKRYGETGDDKYRIAFVHLILDRLMDRMGIRAKLEECGTKPN
jgi:hypothetical protein